MPTRPSRSTTTRATATITLVRLPVARQARVCRARAGRRTSPDICATPGPSCCRPSGTGTPSEMPPTGCFRRVPGWAGRADARFARHDGDDDHTIDSCRHLGHTTTGKTCPILPACLPRSGWPTCRQLRHRRTNVSFYRAPWLACERHRQLPPVPDVGEELRGLTHARSSTTQRLGRADRGRLP
jgi:hypothetical protein